MGVNVQLDRSRCSDLETQLNSVWNADTVYHHENGKKLSLSATPHTIPESQYHYIAESAKTLNKALERIAHYLITDRSDHPDFSNHAAYLQLNQAPRKHGRLTFLSRLDFMLDTEGQAHFIEINSACPAFLFFFARHRALCGDYMGIPAAKFPMLLDQPQYITSKMLDLTKQYYAAPEYPHVAVITGKIGSTVELSLIARRFEQSGATVWRGALEDLTFSDNRLLDGNGQPVDLLYLKDNPPPSINKGWRDEDYGRYAAYLEAIRRDVVCALNPFPGLTLIDDKGLFAFIWTEGAKCLFDDAALQKLRQLVPETHLVDPLDVQHIQQLSRQRSELILKPRLESRSRLIISGKDVEQSAWEQALSSCQPQQWIVQKFCESEPPFAADHEPGWSRCVTIGLVDGEPAGVNSRIAPSSISSATTGASSQAVFIRPDNVAIN